MDLKKFLAKFPFIAITRGILPDEVPACGLVLIEAGFTILETPLNSPDAYTSIRLMKEHFGGQALVGAGTVTEPTQVAEVEKAGGTLIISPHCDVDVIRATKERGLISIPGIATPTEAMTALKAGADALKIFPGEMISPAAVKAMRAILPPQTLLLPVGGITSENWQPYFRAGAAGFGLGSSLYKAGYSLETLKENALRFANTWSESQAHPDSVA